MREHRCSNILFGFYLVSHSVSMITFGFAWNYDVTSNYVEGCLCMSTHITMICIELRWCPLFCCQCDVASIANATSKSHGLHWRLLRMHRHSLFGFAWFVSCCMWFASIGLFCAFCIVAVDSSRLRLAFDGGVLELSFFVVLHMWMNKSITDSKWLRWSCLGMLCCRYLLSAHSLSSFWFRWWCVPCAFVYGLACRMMVLTLVWNGFPTSNWIL